MRPRCVFLHRGEPRIIIPFVLFPLHYWNSCMKFCNTMHTKTQMTLNPVRGPKLKETPFFGLFPAHSGPVYHAIVITSHVLNIITIMITLKIMSLYINVISPHRAANPTLSSRRVFCCLFPAPFPSPISPAVRFPPAPVNCRPAARRLSWRNLREPAAHQGCHRA